jgi:general secretion pathway protein J
MNPNSYKSSGFTLIEVLIAMTLLSIMVVLLFASLKISADSWHKGESKITEVNDVAVVYNFFQQHLATTRPFMNNWSVDTPPTLGFQGKNRSLQFVSSFPASAGKSGLQMLTVSLKKEADDTVIMVALSPFFPVDKGKTSLEEVDLIKGIKEFSLSYFGSNDGSSEGSWQDQWLEKAFLPRLVKINIKLESGFYIPEIIVEIKATAQTDQQINPQANPLQ